MITNIDIDETIVAQAMQLSGARTKREVVDRALRELVTRATRPSVREAFEEIAPTQMIYLEVLQGVSSDRQCGLAPLPRTV